MYNAVRNWKQSSSPEIADQPLKIVGPAVDWTLARGTNLNTRIERIELAWKPISYLDALELVGLARSTDVMTKDAAVDRAILLELVKTNLRNKTLRDFV